MAHMLRSHQEHMSPPWASGCNPAVGLLLSSSLGCLQGVPDLLHAPKMRLSHKEIRDVASMVVPERLYQIEMLFGCSCLENPRDGGAWWAAVYGVTQSRTRLKRLSSEGERVLALESREGTRASRRVVEGL